MDIFIVGIASLITYFFIINLIKKEKTKLLMGMISIIFGGLIIIISLLGIFSFYIYVGVLSGGGMV
ncbi:MAG TPA: hypothetical protein ENH75_07625 [archaeon]|nr:hypothetical protein [archaeon]